MNELEQIFDDLKNKRIFPNQKKVAFATLQRSKDQIFKKILMASLENSELPIKNEKTPLLFTTPYLFIDNAIELNRVLEPYKAQSKSVSLSFLAFDGKGFLCYDPFKAQPAYLSLAFNEIQSLIIDLSKINLNVLTPLLSSRVLKVVYNAPEFLLFTRHLGISVNYLCDIRILDQLLRKGLGNLTPTLSDTVNKFLEREIEFPTLTRDSSILQINQVLATKTVLQMELAPILYHLIRDEQMHELAALENRCTFAITEMIYNGMPFDIDLFNRMRNERKDAVDEIAKKLQAALTYNLDSLFGEIPRSVNLDSHAQLQKAFDRIGIKLPNIQEETLLSLKDRYNEIRLLLEYKKLSYALHHTLSDSYLSHIHPVTHRIHAHVEQNAATTGRIIVSNPNLQGVANGDPRKVFRAPEGWLFVTGDYKQIDVVSMAIISQDEVMLEEISRGEDIYVAAGKIFLQKDIITSTERKKCKPVVLGLIYNMSDSRLCLEAKKMGSELSSEEAATFRQVFFRKYQGIKNLHERLKQESKDTRQVKSLLNRVRAFDNSLLMIDKPQNMSQTDLDKLVNSALHADFIRHSKGIAVKTASYTEAEQFGNIIQELELTYKILPDAPPLGEVFNGPGQMTGVDLLKTAMTDMLPSLSPFEAKFIMTKHDDLTYLVPRKQGESFASVLKNTMEESSVKVFKGIRATAEIKTNVDFS